MESASLLLIIVGAAIIAVVLLARLGMRRRSRDAGQHLSMPRVEPEIDPLFTDIKKEPVFERPAARVAVQDEAPMADEPKPAVIDEPPPVTTKTKAIRQPPRVADDPRRVVVLNIMAGEQGFAGEAVRDALADAGLEFGEWQIFHYYDPNSGAPPLFSLANMVKPGSFDPERMADLQIPGLSLFLVPAGEEGDVAAFDTMLAVARRLAERLGGEVRDGRRSVLTRQAINLVREQLNEWRCRTQAVPR